MDPKYYGGTQKPNAAAPLNERCPNDVLRATTIHTFLSKSVLLRACGLSDGLVEQGTVELQGGQGGHAVFF
jgi:hypothetical protein